MTSSVSKASKALVVAQTKADRLLHEYGKAKAEAEHLREVLREARASDAARRVGTQVKRLTGTGGAFVVVFDYTDEQLGADSGALREGVKVDTLVVAVEGWAASQSREHDWIRIGDGLIDRGLRSSDGVNLVKPFPTGWPKSARSNSAVEAALFDVEAVKRANRAYGDPGDYTWFSSCDELEGRWDCSGIAWRVFYDANVFGGPKVSAPKRQRADSGSA